MLKRRTDDLLVADAVGKSFVESVHEQVRVYVVSNVPVSQYGGLKGWGTDLPNHCAKAAGKRREPSTSSRSHCSFNWNQPPTRLFVRSCLDSLQTQGWQTAVNTATSSTSSASGSPRGTVTQRWSVPHDAQRILNCLHVNSWFSLGAQSSVVVTAPGGGQGCELGGVVFGAVCKDCVCLVWGKARILENAVE